MELSSYQKLLVQFPPRRITSQAEYDQVWEQMDRLVTKEGRQTKDEEDFYFVLSLLVEKYEQEQSLEIDGLYGIELLKELMQQQNLRQKDLIDIFKTKSIISEVLKGKRKLTVEHIQKLSERFRLPAQKFMPRSS